MMLFETEAAETREEERLTIDRRSFLGGVGLMAGAVMASSLVPLSTVQAIAQLPATPAADGTWHVDDMWGHWPRYSHPIGYGHVPSTSASLFAHADPIDHIFLS
jgi:hypothetical protein